MQLNKYKQDCMSELYITQKLTTFKAQKTLALLVGVSDYSELNWSKISSVSQPISADHAKASCQKLKETLSLYDVRDLNKDVYCMEDGQTEEQIHDAL